MTIHIQHYQLSSVKNNPLSLLGNQLRWEENQSLLSTKRNWGQAFQITFQRKLEANFGEQVINECFVAEFQMVWLFKNTFPQQDTSLSILHSSESVRGHLLLRIMGSNYNFTQQCRLGIKQIQPEELNFK